MNGKIDVAKTKFIETLRGLSVETEGIVSNHDEALTVQGAQQIWNALKLADLQVTARE